MELTWCPECGGPAEMEWRSPVDSTDGPVDHVKVSCVRRHWFLMPAARLPEPAASRPWTEHRTHRKPS
jgi:hypothetical protein